MKQRILLVEDDRSISEMVEAYLSLQEYEVVHAEDGAQALQKFRQEPYDMVLLDIMLPKLSGMEFLKKIREHSRVPVLILSAKDGDVDKALGLGFGADDYLAKPFSMIELLARVKAAIRRATEYAQKPGTTAADSAVIRVHELVIDPERIELTKRGIPIKLTAKEWQIISLLAQHRTKVFTKEQIYRSVWKDEYYGDENVINVHIRRLREKLEDDPSSPQYIQTLWGIGYKLGDF